MPSKNSTWYVAADGKQVRILQRDGHSIHELQRFDADGKGDTSHDADTSVSHIHSPTSDPRTQAKEHFARHVAKHLNDAVRDGAMEHFHLAAPAHVLHDIVTHLDKPAEQAMLSKQSKDLMHNTPEEVIAHFKDEVI